MFRWNFHFPKIKFGIGRVREIGDEVTRFRAKNVFLITDENIIKLGLLDPIIGSLKNKNIEFEIFDEVKPNPEYRLVQKAIDIARRKKFDLLIGVGGGSTIDVTKAVGAIAVNEGTLLDYLHKKRKIINRPLPRIVIPTNAGGGPYWSPWIIITVDGNKISIRDDDYYLPEVVIMDPEMTKTLPPQITVAGAMDALSSAIEGYCSKGSTRLGEDFTLKAIAILSKYLPRAFGCPEDMEAREMIMIADLLQSIGSALSNSRCTAVHALGESIGGMYNLPHGITLAIFLPYILEYNLLTCSDRYVRIAEAIGEKVEDLSTRDAALKAIAAVKNLIRDLRIPSLREVGVQTKDIPKLAEIAFKNINLQYNPRKIDKKDIEEIFKNALKE